jgi:hypothetical protein
VLSNNGGIMACSRGGSRGRLCSGPCSMPNQGRGRERASAQADTTIARKKAAPVGTAVELLDGC